MGEYSIEVRETLERVYNKRKERALMRRGKKNRNCNSLHNWKVVYEHEFLEKILSTCT